VYPLERGNRLPNLLRRREVMVREEVTK